MRGKFPAESSIPENTIINHTSSPLWDMSNDSPVLAGKGAGVACVLTASRKSRSPAGGRRWTPPKGAPPSLCPPWLPPRCQRLWSIFSMFGRRPRRPWCSLASVRSRCENCKPALGFEACVSLWFIPHWVGQTRLREITGSSRLKQIH